MLNPLDVFVSICYYRVVTSILWAALFDIAVEVLRALIKRKLGRKQLPEPLEDQEVK